MAGVEFTVTSNGTRHRLDILLAAHCPDITRSRIKKLIESGLVKVDGAVQLKPGATVQPGSLIELEVPEAEPAGAAAENIPLNILYEDSDLLVLDKQPHLVVHPAHGHGSGTLVNALLHHCRDLSGIGGVTRPGIVHRLDKGTSGIMVVAKNDSTHNGLAVQFKDHSIERSYLAAVRGAPRPEEGVIERPLGRHTRDRKKIAVREDGRRAVTRYRLIGRRGPISLVELHPATGRTHQLRVHLASIGHPILGDATYGGGVSSISPKDPRARTLMRALKRPALHAASLAFVHPATGSRMRFQAPPPADLRELFLWIEGRDDDPA